MDCLGSDNVRQSYCENSAILLRALRQTALQHKSRRRRSSHEAIPAAGSFQHETPAAAAAAVVGRRHEEVPAARRAELDAAAAAGRARRRRRGGDVPLPDGRRGRAREVPRAGAGASTGAGARGATVARDARAGRATTRNDARYRRGPLRATYTLNYLSEVLSAQGDTIEQREHWLIDANIRHSLSASYDFGTYLLRGGVNNFTDEEPSYPTRTHGDIIGRYYFMGVTARF